MTSASLSTQGIIIDLTEFFASSEFLLKSFNFLLFGFLIDLHYFF